MCSICLGKECDFQVFQYCFPRDGTGAVAEQDAWGMCLFADFAASEDFPIQQHNDVAGLTIYGCTQYLCAGRDVNGAERSDQLAVSAADGKFPVFAGSLQASGPHDHLEILLCAGSWRLCAGKLPIHDHEPPLFLQRRELGHVHHIVFPNIVVEEDSGPVLCGMERRIGLLHAGNFRKDAIGAVGFVDVFLDIVHRLDEQIRRFSREPDLQYGILDKQ